MIIYIYIYIYMYVCIYEKKSGMLESMERDEVKQQDLKKKKSRIWRVGGKIIFNQFVRDSFTKKVMFEQIPKTEKKIFKVFKAETLKQGQVQGV